ncbi:hypothetical protein BpHYR1_030634 [Brachionus plicatilis]|uniref:Uncharacterized protein n=1 Tax=Brachionus plicatilis TaxID=10195 RepID=A0A3M7RD56_BRAPC|nr:hypothetical protein BpHYR1_030634 [Brachionus plicatilis]
MALASVEASDEAKIAAKSIEQTSKSNSLGPNFFIKTQNKYFVRRYCFRENSVLIKYYTDIGQIFINSKIKWCSQSWTEGTINNVYNIDFLQGYLDKNSYLSEFLKIRNFRKLTVMDFMNLIQKCRIIFKYHY